MSVYDIGRICIKTMGREAGNYCVVVDIIDKNYILVDGLTIRRRRVNYKHVEPIAEMVELKKGSDHKTVEAAIKKAKLSKKMKEKVSLPLA